jgi:4'-phosphopantetheinyl transferase
MSNPPVESGDPLAPGEVRVVEAGLGLPPARLDALLGLLAPDERARAERFVFDVHRRRFAAARGLLRELLGRLLEKAPASLRFEYGPHGKPRLRHDPGTALSFNVSHSGERALFAFARGRELGVDIEAVRAEIDHAAIAARFFAEGERRALLELPEAEQAPGFFTIWTRKEACVKLLGGGLAIGLDAFEVSLDEPARLRRVAAAPGERLRQASLHALAAPIGFKAALAYTGGTAAVRTTRAG